MQLPLRGRCARTREEAAALAAVAAPLPDAAAAAVAAAAALAGTRTPGGALPDAVSEVGVPAAGSAVVDDPAVVAVERARQVPAALTTPR